MLPWAVLPIGRPEWAAELPGLTAAIPFLAHSLPRADLTGRRRAAANPFPCLALPWAKNGRRYTALGRVGRPQWAVTGLTGRRPAALLPFHSLDLPLRCPGQRTAAGKGRVGRPEWAAAGLTGRHSLPWAKNAAALPWAVLAVNRRRLSCCPFLALPWAELTGRHSLALPRAAKLAGRNGQQQD